jgi:HEAT repeat protein
MATDATDEIFWGKHRLDERAVAALSQDEIARVEEIARGRVASDFRVKALEVLAAARGAEAVGALVDTALDGSLDSALRAAAVVQLGRKGGAEAEGALVRLVEGEEDVSVRLRAAQALAKIGSPEALKPLGALADAADPSVARRAAFARSVLAYRQGLAGFELPRPGNDDLVPPPQHEVAAVESAPASLHEAAAALDDLRQDSYGLRLVREQSYAVDCGLVRLLLALDADAVRDMSASAEPRPRLLGLVAERSPEDGSFSVRWLVFSTPAERGLDLAVHRQTGEHVLFGPAVPSRGVVRFELGAVAAVGNPAVQVSGELRRGRLTLAGTSAATVGIGGSRGKNIPLAEEGTEVPPPGM